MWQKYKTFAYYHTFNCFCNCEVKKIIFKCIFFSTFVVVKLRIQNQNSNKFSCNYMKNIVLLASGSGSNAENIIGYFRKKNILHQFHIITNKKDAFVLERAKKLGVTAEIITKKQNDEGVLEKRLLELNPDLIVLAGYLLLFPADIVQQFPNKIINIDRKSTRLNSSHVKISYAVFCLKKK